MWAPTRLPSASSARSNLAPPRMKTESPRFCGGFLVRATALPLQEQGASVFRERFGQEHIRRVVAKGGPLVVGRDHHVVDERAGLSVVHARRVAACPDRFQKVVRRKLPLGGAPPCLRDQAGVVVSALAFRHFVYRSELPYAGMLDRVIVDFADIPCLMPGSTSFQNNDEHENDSEYFNYS